MDAGSVKLSKQTKKAIINENIIQAIPKSTPCRNSGNTTYGGYFGVLFDSQPASPIGSL